jgi:hypothetical protein
MADNTVTLVVNGEVSLETFSQALAHFNELIQGLNEETNASVEWLIQDLQVSSAVVASMGKGEAKQVENIVVAYEDVASSLEKDTEIKHSPRVNKAALQLRSLPDKRVPSILMQTAKRDAVVQNRIHLVPVSTSVAIAELPVPQVAPKPAIGSIIPAYGAIEGRIQTLTNRGGLRFTLYDLLYDKAVSCYVAEGKQELLRDMWGKLAMVEGVISRDPENGRPLSIREVGGITPLSDAGGPLEYQEARGAAPSLNTLSPEEAIRRVRDAQ